MARILRRRIARHTPSATSRRNTAAEINQWLRLGLTAAQIGEKLIPDDPKTSPEAYSEVLKARFQSPGQDDDYDVFVKEQIQPPPQAGGPSQPAAPPPQPDAEGVGPILDNLGQRAPAPAPEPPPVQAGPLQAEKDQVKRTVAGAATARQGNFERVMSNFNRGLAIVHENSHPWNRGEKIDLYIAAFEKNLGKSPLMNSGSAKSRRDAVDIYVANKRAQTAEARIADAGVARTHEGDMVTKREDVQKRKEGRKLETVTAEEKRDADEYNRRKKAEGAEWDRRRKVYNKHQRRLVRLRGKVQSEKKKGKRVPSGYGATITKAADKISRYVGSVDELLLLRSKPAFLAALAAKTEDESVSLFGEEELAWKQAEAQEAIATRLFGEMEALKASVNTIGGADFSIEFDEVEGVPSLGLTDDDVDAEAGKIIDAIRPPQ